MKDLKIAVTYESILNSGAWEDMCDKYGINPWILNEGRADNDDTISITVEDAQRWGLLNSPEQQQEETFSENDIRKAEVDMLREAIEDVLDVLEGGGSPNLSWVKNRLLLTRKEDTANQESDTI
jgi:hypothetical protein